MKQQQQQAADGRPLTVLHTADYLLEGAIMMLSGREGRIREKSYTFQLKLNNTRTQRVAWQKTVDVSKQTTKPAVSW